MRHHFATSFKSDAVNSITWPQFLLYFQVSPLFGTIYDGFYFMAMAINSARRKGVRLSGANIAQHTKNLSFPGFSYQVETDHCGKGLSNYVILDTDGHGNQLFPTHLLDMSSDSVTSLGQDIHFPGGTLPKPDSSCWFDPDVLCTGGKQDIKAGLNGLGSMLLISFIFSLITPLNQSSPKRNF